MVLQLTPEVISMVIGLSTEKGDSVLFNPETYEFIKVDKTIPKTVSHEEMIEFPRIPEVEVQQAYVASLNDRTISNQFRHLPNEEFWKQFWQLFDDGGFWLTSFRAFEKEFYTQTVIKWCRNNGIAYYVPNKRK